MTACSCSGSRDVRVLPGALSLILISAWFLSPAAASAEENIFGANVCGYTRVYLPPSNGLVLAAMNFRPFDPTLLGVFGTNQLRSGFFASAADKVIFWDPATQQYQQYALRNTDWQFHGCRNAQQWTNAPMNVALSNGAAFWIQSPNSSTTTNAIVFMGQAVESAGYSSGMISGLQMRCYGLSSEINIQDTHFAADGATPYILYSQADRINVWTNGGYMSYALKDDGKWYPARNLPEWMLSPPTSNVFQLGQGFWYQARNPFVWTETNQYSRNL